MTAGESALLQILLVIILCLIEPRRRRNLRDDWPAIPAAALALFLRRFGCGLLIVVVIKNRRAVLLTDIRSLSVERRRIVILPENRKQIVIAESLRIVANLDDFGMTGSPAANVLIRGVLHRSAQIPDTRRKNSRYLAICGFYSPEASRAKRGNLRILHCFIHHHLCSRFFLHSCIARVTDENDACLPRALVKICHDHRAASSLPVAPTQRLLRLPSRPCEDRHPHLCHEET